MTIETTRSMYCFWTGYFQSDSRKHVVMVTIDKSVVRTNGEESVAEVTRRCYSILIIYEHALEPYTKLSSHTATLSNTPERTNELKTGKKSSITI